MFWAIVILIVIAIIGSGKDFDPSEINHFEEDGTGDEQ
jgi:hypothetical protein